MQDQVENRVQGQMQEQVEDRVQGQMQEQVEDRVQGQMQEQVEDRVRVRVQKQVEELVQKQEQEQLQEWLRAQEQGKSQEWDRAQENEQIQVQNQPKLRIKNRINWIRYRIRTESKIQTRSSTDSSAARRKYTPIVQLETNTSAGQKLEKGAGQQPISEAISYENWETHSSSREGSKRNRGSSMMERLIKLVTKQVTEQGIEASPYVEAAFPSQIHRKPSVMDNGLESVVKIQSNEKLLKQLVQRQKQRQNSSNDSFVGSIHTVPQNKLKVISDHLTMTTHIPRIMRRENIVQSNADKPLSIARSAANPNVESRMQSHSEAVQLQPNRITGAAVKAQRKADSAQLSFRKLSYFNREVLVRDTWL